MSQAPQSVHQWYANRSPIQPYKNALAYADLTQLPGISSLSAANQSAFVNAIVGWRNFASSGFIPSKGIFPNTYTFSTLTTFDQNIIFNANGFLTVGGPIPSKYGYGPQIDINAQGAANQTDNAFVSRQQLLQFFIQGLGQNSTFTGKVPLTTLVNVLPYLGTFSRDLSQPSYAPDPTRPVVVAQASGGNSLTTGGASGGDAIVNPPFLSKTATTAFTRNDGSTAVVGEPLVKKRFALNRLTWLTYLGASASRTIPATNPGAGTTNDDMWLLVNTYGIPTNFLQQGTAINIYNYFGLTWLPVSITSPSGTTKTSMWVYSHPGGYIAPNGALPVTTAPAVGSGTSILTLAQVQALGREPDFVELLKAAICTGSIGKLFFLTVLPLPPIRLLRPSITGIRTLTFR